MSDSVLFEIENNIAYLTLNRPSKRNAFDDNMINVLLSHLDSAKQNSEIRALVLKGEGDHFSAGADLSWMQRTVHYTQSENYEDALNLGQLMHQLFYFPKPTIAIVQGAAYGGGAGLVACADIVIARDDAQFCFSEVKLGVIPAVISPFVMYKIGPSATQRYFLTAEIITAAQAKVLGLCHVLVTEQTEVKHLEELLKRIKKNGPKAVGAVKQLMRSVYTQPINNTTLETTANHIAALRASDEGQEGITAFLEKRKPFWDNK